MYTYRGIEKEIGEALGGEGIRTVSLSDKQDFDTVLKNPHKGLYHHYYDNSLDKYLCESDEELTRIKGLTVLYLRFDWSDFEPEEGKFNRELTDDIIERFCKPYGYKLSILICCKESGKGQTFATPGWVADAGAKGCFRPPIDVANDKISSFGKPGKPDWVNWTPDYGDPIFLKKLENMHRAFAEIYGDSPYIEDVVVGSMGDWGEGHTCCSGRERIPMDVIKKHIDIYARCYPNTQKIINDDVIRYNFEDDPQSERELLQYCIDKGFGMRDDGIGVKYFADKYPDTYTVARPWYFEKVSPHYPTVIELEHYSDMLESGCWEGENGCISGADFSRGALDLMHASYFSFHGYARDWYAENAELADELANKCGYWYFLESVSVSCEIQSGADFELGFKWINRGVARAYHRYSLSVRLEGENGSFTAEAKNSDNRKWLPYQTTGEVVSVSMPKPVPSGAYKLKIRLDCTENGRSVPIKIALKKELLDSNGYYTVAENISVE